MREKTDLDPAIAAFAGLARSIGTATANLHAFAKSLDGWPVQIVSPKRAKTRAQRKARKVERRHRK